MTKPLIALTLIGMIVAALAFAQPKKDTIVFHTADLNQATKIITDNVKVGYHVVSITAQPVSTTTYHRTEHRDLYGELFVILER